MMEEKTLCTVCRREANVFVMQRLRLFNGCVFGSGVFRCARNAAEKFVRMVSMRRC